MKNTKTLLLFPLLFIFFFFISQSQASKLKYNVQNFGAKPDGVTDSTKAFLTTWATICNSSNSAILSVPTGRFLLGSLTFDGTRCKSESISVQISGTLVAPSNYNVIGNAGTWIKFQKVNRVSVKGGTLDAQGSALWNCKTSGKSCPTGATSLAFKNSNDIAISKLSSLNSQKFHILIYGCRNAKLQGITITAAGNSPNTDGIHVELSSSVTILKSKIGTGDDCISIGPGSSNLWIQNVDCGPGHGISIGSLGWDLQEAGVQNVTVNTATFRGTENGVRIKTWARPSNGFVRGVTFQHLTMINVHHPMLIQQDYCPTHTNCPNQESGVQISDVMYKDVHGTSAMPIAVDFDCSRTYPCREIYLQDVNLNFNGQPAEASCENAQGTASGQLQPSSCL